MNTCGGGILKLRMYLRTLPVLSCVNTSRYCTMSFGNTCTSDVYSKSLNLTTLRAFSRDAADDGDGDADADASMLAAFNLLGSAKCSTPRCVDPE